MFTTLQDEVVPQLKARNIQILVQPIPQPWHPQSPMLHEAAFAVYELLGNDGYLKMCRAIFDAIPGPFQDIDTFDKSRNQIYAELADLASQPAVFGGSFPKEKFLSLLKHQQGEAQERNNGTAVTQRLKWHVRYQRTRRVHVSPTVFVNGQEASAVSSGWNGQQWLEFLAPYGVVSWPSVCQNIDFLQSRVNKLNTQAMALRISGICASLHLDAARVKIVPSDYYERTLEERRTILNAPSVESLTKTLVLENSCCTNDDCSDPANPKYFCVIVQYCARFNSEKMMKYARQRCNASGKAVVGKQFFKFHLCPPKVSFELTGYDYNAVVPLGMPVDVPVVMSHKIAELSPAFFWMGAGDVDAKLGLNVPEYIKRCNVDVADITYDEGEGQGDDLLSP
mmetsp:Transcript_24517/g.57916  ORF Transcript_24517/g.57916 Transcript_24517/m.57916 type:complete len:395 (+) Transcript_24517:41-1225(+)